MKFRPVRSKHKSRSRILRELVIGFGFLSGVWTALGINPAEKIMEFIRPIIENVHPLAKTILIAVPLCITIYMLARIYIQGGIIGALAVFAAFIAGTFLFTATITSIIVLGCALILGLFSFKDH